SLHADGVSNDPLQRLQIARQDFFRAAPHEVKKRAIANHAALERLKQSGAKLPLVERLQDFGVDQHDARLVKRTDQVFARAQVDSGLAADAGIQLGHDRGGKLDYRNAAHKDSRQETGAVTDYAAAKGHDQRLAIRLGIHQLVGELFHGVQALGRLAVMHLKNLIG